MDCLQHFFYWHSKLWSGAYYEFEDSLYSKASRYTASTYTDFTDTLFLIGSRKILATLILSLFFTDTRLFTSGKIKIIEFSLSKSEFVP